MFIRKETAQRVEFIDKHGNKIGYCSLIEREKETGERYAIIDAEIPHYSEYTTWHDLAEAKQAYRRDIQEYTEQFKNI